jgi:UDP-3-O-[3-hydroxymyristoyl] N-acetylglucosamine deacetylase
MFEDFQKTIAKRIEIRGIGLHSGNLLRMELLPADAGSGIQFKRTDLINSPSILAHVSNIVATDLNTTIGSGAARVATIEHLMAAFAGLGIDNVLVKIDGPEVPVMDGSAAPFVEAILAAGLATQSTPRKLYIVRKPFELQQGEKWIKVEPSDEISFSMEIDFRSRAIGCQRFSLTWNRDSLNAIYSSRTFCHANDVNMMQKAGLALGGSLDNAVVVSDDEVLNPSGLRYSDEFVRHKILDCVGDMYMFGAPIVGKVSAYKSGHGLHASFMKSLWANRSDVLSVSEAVGSFGASSSHTAAVVGLKG